MSVQEKKPHEGVSLPPHAAASFVEDRDLEGKYTHEEISLPSQESSVPFVENPALERK
jgi:hypothetical protein